jgi:hypothetical protein
MNFFGSITFWAGNPKRENSTTKGTKGKLKIESGKRTQQKYLSVLIRCQPIFIQQLQQDTICQSFSSFFYFYVFCGVIIAFRPTLFSL